jgi:hypothetical protein
LIQGLQGPHQYSAKVHTIAGDLDAADGWCWKDLDRGAISRIYAFLSLLQPSPNDGIVTAESARPTWSATRALLTGFDHSELHLGDCDRALASDPLFEKVKLILLSLLGTEPLTLVGSAQSLSGILALTDASPWQGGAAWTTTKGLLRPGFVGGFILRFTTPRGLGDLDGQPGADGIAFVIQSHRADALGALGDGKGYAGIPNSLAIEFDTWRNPWDLDGNHVGVHTAGASPNSSTPETSLGSIALPFDLSDGNAHSVWIDYAPGALRVFVDEALRLAIAVDLSNVDGAGSTILDADGKAWVGFTAATGSAWQVQQVSSWVLPRK